MEMSTLKPISQESIQQAGEVALPGLGLDHVFLCQSDQNGFLSLRRSASALALTGTISVTQLPGWG